jgi:D-alanine-D-alanine ligase-like ATP-grasp enzyme
LGREDSITSGEQRPSHIHVLAPPLSRDRVSWVQLSESRAVAAELLRMGYRVTWSFYRGAEHLRSDAIPLLRLSDALMGKVAAEMERGGIAYGGPSSTVYERCYDKFKAYEVFQRADIPYPRTVLGHHQHPFEGSIFLKPRRGSDSIGTRIVPSGIIPPSLRRKDYLVQPFIEGDELTIAVIGTETIGVPMHILLPRRRVYSFVRKNLWKTKSVELEDGSLSQNIREFARRVASALEVDWAARIDMLYDPGDDRLYVLECDACPTVSASSTFAESLTRAGIAREKQIGLILQKGM